jgi:hypothetical protein
MKFGSYFTGKIEYIDYTVQSVKFEKLIDPFSENKFKIMNILSGESLVFS